jgi:hypothetical protein
MAAKEAAMVTESPESGEAPEHFEVCVVREGGNQPSSKWTSGGSAASTAAYLRALADEIHPRRPAMRGGQVHITSGPPAGISPATVIAEVREAVRRHGPRALGL